MQVESPFNIYLNMSILIINLKVSMVSRMCAAVDPCFKFERLMIHVVSSIVSPEIEPGYIVFPSHNQKIMYSLLLGVLLPCEKLRNF